MQNKKILIVGYGSIAKKHYSRLIKLNSKENIFFFSRRNIKLKNQLKNYNEIKIFNPDFIYICVETSMHIKYLEKFIILFSNKIIFLEKPLFHKNYKIKDLNNNKIFVGYNLRFHPIIIFIKNFIKNKKVYSVNIEASSFLPKWRKNINYQNTYSASKSKGGGVLLDLSHELDYLIYFFKKFKLEYIKNLKISDLNITSDDFLVLNASNPNIKSINLTLSYISLLSKRIIFINGKNFSINADLIRNNITLITNRIKKIYNFKSSDCDTYYLLNKSLLTKNYKLFANYNDGIEVINLINKIKNFK